jgi:The GLUG motif
MNAPLRTLKSVMSFRTLNPRALAPVVLMTVIAALPARAALVISSAQTSNVTCSGGVCVSTAANAVLNASQLMTMLAAANVTVQSESKARDIVFNAELSWTSTAALTLDSFRSIRVNRNVTDGGTNIFNIAWNGGGSQGGVFSFASAAHLTFWDLHSMLTINGHAYTLVSCVSSLAQAASGNPSGRFALAASCDAGPDGVYSVAPVSQPFAGAFEGFKNSIANLRIADLSGSHDVGLFADFDNTAAVENLRLTKLSVRGGNGVSVGGLVGNATSAPISGVTVAGTVGGGVSSFVGGLAGRARNVTSSTSAGTVTGGDDAEVGGLLGQSSGGLSLSSSSATVAAGNTVNMSASAGGLVGYAVGASVTSSFATGKISVGDAPAGNAGFAGGLVGSDDEAELQTSYATGAVKGGANSVLGGLDGNAFGSIDQCFALGSIKGRAGAVVGGLVGHNSAPVSNSFALGKVKSGQGSTVGGFVGQNSNVLTSDYSAGHVKGAVAGGFAGYDQGSSASSYWDTTTSGSAKGTGTCASTCQVTGLTDAELKSALPAGFDTSIWGIDAAINGGLPYLLAVSPP